MLKLFVSVDKHHTPFRNTYNNAVNVIRDLCCSEQIVYRVSESAFHSFFRQANDGKCCC